MLSATGFGHHPGSARHRRLMAHVLPVPALQIGDPIALIILMVADDALLHNHRVPTCSSIMTTKTPTHGSLAHTG